MVILTANKESFRDFHIKYLPNDTLTFAWLKNIEAHGKVVREKAQEDCVMNASVD